MKRREKKTQEQRSFSERSRVGASRQKKKEGLITRSCLITPAGTKPLALEGTSGGPTESQADFEEANGKG